MRKGFSEERKMEIDNNFEEGTVMVNILTGEKYIAGTYRKERGKKMRNKTWRIDPSITKEELIEELENTIRYLRDNKRFKDHPVVAKEYQEIIELKEAIVYELRLKGVKVNFKKKGE